MWLTYLLFWANALAHPTHPVHLTVTDLTLNPKTSVFQVSTKFFLDDIELALKKQTKKDLNIGTKQELPQTNELLLDYMAKHLVLEQKNMPLKYKFVGKEIEDETLWVYLETPKTAQKSLQITNRILIECYGDQLNLLHFVGKNQKKTFKFSSENTTQSVVIK